MARCIDCRFQGVMVQSNGTNDIIKYECQAGAEVIYTSDWFECERECDKFEEMRDRKCE